MKYLVLFPAFLIVQFSFAQSPDTCLVSHYPLNGNGQDIGPFNNDGVIIGSTASANRHGISNTALYFDGDDYLDLDSLIPNLYTWTISFWIKHMGGQDHSTIFSDLQSFAGNDFYVELDQDSLFIRADKAGSTLFSSIKFPQSIDGIWTHVAWTYRNSISKIYMNGNLLGTITSSASNYSFHSSNPTIGCWYDGPHTLYPNHQRFLQGHLDDLKIYRCELSPAEISSLFVNRDEIINESAELRIYPNPADRHLHILKGSGQFFQIVTLTGAVLFSSESPFKSGDQIDVSQYTPGLYFLKYYDENQNSFEILKFLIQH